MRCGCGYGCVDMVVPNAQWQSMGSSTRASVVINCECTHMSVLTHWKPHTHVPSCSCFLFITHSPVPLPLSLCDTHNIFEFSKKENKNYKIKLTHGVESTKKVIYRSIVEANWSRLSSLLFVR